MEAVRCKILSALVGSKIVQTNSSVRNRKQLSAYNIDNFVADNQEECEYHWHNGQVQHG
jgi:hypothetical protein